MDRLLIRIQRVRPAAFTSRDFFLLHDNAPAHKAAFANFWPKKCYYLLLLPPAPCSPDLSPLDYFLFPKLKMKLKGLHFADVAEIQKAVTDELKKIQKQEFSAAFQKLCDRAKACIYANGAYFE
jgi:histone-lysine N-methyltransferase SETMAR